MNNILAPIVIFTYRRDDVKKVINSLLKNELSKQTDLIIYSDGNKNQDDLKDIKNVRKYLRTISGFKSISIFESQVNKGLAKSIINGVTETINKYDKIIVLEDDLIVSKDFIQFMNEGLDYYEKTENIWSISGYAPNLPYMKDYDKDLYLALRSSSWGWASWKDRWNKIDWEINDFEQIKNSKELQNKFNQGGNDLYKMLELQMLGKIDSWAIRWCYNQYTFNQYTVYPRLSKIINDGFEDDKGTHNNTANDKWKVKANNNSIKFIDLKIDKDIIKDFKQYHDLSTFTKIGYFLRKSGGYSYAKKILKVFKK